MKLWQDKVKIVASRALRSRKVQGKAICMTNSLTRKAHARAILVLGLPLIGSHLAQMLLHVTDTVMLGWYGVTELAAVVIASSSFFVIFILGAGFAQAIWMKGRAVDREATHGRDVGGHGPCPGRANDLKPHRTRT